MKLGLFVPDATFLCMNQTHKMVISKTQNLTPSCCSETLSKSYPFCTCCVWAPPGLGAVNLPRVFFPVANERQMFPSGELRAQTQPGCWEGCVVGRDFWGLNSSLVVRIAWLVSVISFISCLDIGQMQLALTRPRL